MCHTIVSFTAAALIVTIEWPSRSFCLGMTTDPREADRNIATTTASDRPQRPYSFELTLRPVILGLNVCCGGVWGVGVDKQFIHFCGQCHS